MGLGEGWGGQPGVSSGALWCPLRDTSEGNCLINNWQLDCADTGPQVPRVVHGCLRGAPKVGNPQMRILWLWNDGGGERWGLASSPCPSLVLCNLSLGKPTSKVR